MRCLSAFLGMFVAATVCAQQTSRAQVRLVDQKTHAKYLAYLPSSVDGVLDRIKAREDIIFYDSEVMPPAYQDYFGALHGFVPTTHNISADRSEPIGNASDFPWRHPAGTDNSNNSRTYKFLLLPDAGKKIVAWRQRLDSDNDPAGTYLWQFPEGTVFGEVLLVANPRTGTSYTYEVRLRTKTGPEFGVSSWSVNAYRPFVRPDDLATRVREIRPSFELDVRTPRFLAGLRRPRLSLLALRDRHDRTGLSQGASQATATAADVSAFNRSGLEEKLEPIDDGLVIDLLTKTPFRSVLGKEWRVDGQSVAHAPSTDADFHIVPRGYFAYMVAVDKQSCQSCHESSLKRADEFQPFKNWYGRIKGGDGILSFHPVDPASFSRGSERQVKFRRELSSVLDWRGHR